MSCNVTIGEFPLNLYGEFASSANNCWENDNVFLIEAVDGRLPRPVHGKYPRANANELTTGRLYYAAVVVYNTSESNRQVTSISFSFPSFVEVDSEEVKTIDGRSGQVNQEDVLELPSMKAFKFIHQGNYGVAATLLSWSPVQEGENDPASSKGNNRSIYAKNNLFVANLSDTTTKEYPLSPGSLPAALKCMVHESTFSIAPKMALYIDQELVHDIVVGELIELPPTENYLLKISLPEESKPGASAIYKLTGEDEFEGMTLIVNHLN